MLCSIFLWKNGKVLPAFSKSMMQKEDGLLRVDCGDPESDPGVGTETALWFQPDSHQLLRGEISREGFRAIRCDFSDFSKT